MEGIFNQGVLCLVKKFWQQGCYKVVLLKLVIQNLKVFIQSFFKTFYFQRAHCTLLR
jgi:hypothetical protein